MSALRDGIEESGGGDRVLVLGDPNATAAFERAGHVTAPTTDAALEALANGRFDCLLIDASGSRGAERLEGANRLREGSPAVPIVAFCDGDAAPDADAAGVTDVVRAPLASLSLEEVANELPIVLGRSDAGTGCHEAIADLGRRSLDGAPLAALLERAVALVRDALSLDRCGAFELTAEGTLFLREGVGWEPDAVGDLTIDANGGSVAARALAGEPVAGALGSEARIDGSDPSLESVEGGVCVVVGSAEEPWGVLCASASDPRTFDGSDVGLVRSVANVLAGAVERERADRRRLETELEEVYGRVTDAFVALDADARVTHLNDRAERLLGLPAERLVGREIWEPFPTVFEETFREDYWEAMERQESIERERYYPLLDRWYEGRAYPSESGLSVYFRDVTERNRTEQKLREERNLKARIVETSPIGIVVTDADGRMTFANERAQSVFDCSEAEILARSHDDERWNAVDGNGDPLDPEAVPFARVKRTETPVFDEEIGIDRSDGRRVWLSSNCAPLFDAEGEFDGAVYAFEDVTDRRRLESELGELLGRVTDGFFGLDAEWRFTFLNDRAEELINPEGRDLVGESIWERFPEAVGTNFEECYRRAMETQQPASFEEHYPEPLDAWFEVNTYPSETGLSVYFNEITERKERERDLELFRGLLDRATDAIYVNDPETGEFLDVNETASRHLGYDREELLGMTVPDVDLTVPDRRAWRSLVEEIRTEGRLPVDSTHRRKDGSTFPAEVNASYIELDGGREYVVAVGRDATERRERERALRAERDLIERIVETSPVGIVTFDDDGRFDLVNERAEEILGCSRTTLEELAGSTDGLEPVGSDGKALALDEIPTRRVLTEGETFHDDELGFRRPDGERVWLSVSGTPLRGEDGATAGGVITFADVTDRTRAASELRRRVDQQRTVADLGQRALAIGDLDTLLEDACELVADVLDTSYAKVLDLDPDARELLIRAGVGWRDGTVGEVCVPVTESTQAGYTLLTEKPIITDDLSGETRFLGHDVLSSHGVVSGITAVIGPVEDPWGVLGVHDVEHRAFTEYDADFVRSVANVLANAIDRIGRERELERYETIVETVNDGIYVIDERGRFTTVNETYASMLGYDREELVGEHASLVVDDAVIDAAREIERAMHAGEVERPSLEATIRDRNDERFEVEATFALLPDADGSAERVGVVRDITDRKRIERQLRLSAETLHGLYELTSSPELPFEEKLGRVLEAGCERLGLEYGIFTRIEDDTMTIVQSHADHELYRPGASCPLSRSYCRRVLEEEGLVVVDDALAEGWVDDPAYETFELETYAGGQVVVGDEVYGTICFSSSEPRGEPLSEIERTFVELVNGWVSYELERTENQHELERRMRQQRAVAAFGQRSLAAENLDSLFQEACETVADVLDAEYCKVLDLDPDARELLLRRGVGWRDGIVGDATVAADERSQAGYTLLSEEPVIVDDLDEETRFSGPALLTSHDVVSGISVIIGPIEEPWGILGVHDVERREFTAYDADFVQNVANVLANAIDRIERERRLERQREQLASLDQLNAVIRQISHGILESASREEIETAVCERLADRYRFAWIGGVGRGTNAVTPTAAAGVEEGYLDGIEVSLARDDPRGRGPTAEAIRSREPQFRTNVLEDPAYEPWHEAAREREYRSSAAIPIQHEESLYGVLNVYSACPEAFGETERDVLTHLGEIVGHTLYAVEQRNALTSDTVLELEFRLDDTCHPLIEAASTDDVEITLERLIPGADGAMLQFITVRGMDAAAFEDAMGRYDSVERVALLSEDDDGALFELRTSSSPLADSLSGFGGRITNAMVTDGEFRMIAELPPTVDVRAVVTAVKSASGGAELLAQRTETRDRTTHQELGDVLANRLTEKQRAALETSYFAGYFDWPRGHTGEEVAELLGLSPATLSQHLRIAERKLFDALFAES